MIRSVIRFLVVSLCVLMIFPTLTVSSAGKAFVEGFHIDVAETHHNSLRITVDAIKRVDGRSRRSEVHITYHYAYVDGSRDFDANVVLDGDPDNLEVSRDLGWGGLDTVIQVQQRRVDCVFNPDRVCGPEIVEVVPVEFHIAVVANEPTYQDGNLFKRNATLNPAAGGVSGTISVPGRVHSLALGQGLFSSGYNFSDQFPG